MCKPEKTAIFRVDCVVPIIICKQMKPTILSLNFFFPIIVSVCMLFADLDNEQKCVA